MSRCTAATFPTEHEAEGYLVSPEGRRIAPQCREHADRVIREYREKLGEEWTFAPSE